MTTKQQLERIHAVQESLIEETGTLSDNVFRLEERQRRTDRDLRDLATAVLWTFLFLIFAGLIIFGGLSF